MIFRLFFSWQAAGEKKDWEQTPPGANGGRRTLLCIEHHLTHGRSIRSAQLVVARLDVIHPGPPVGVWGLRVGHLEI